MVFTGDADICGWRRRRIARRRFPRRDGGEGEDELVGRVRSGMDFYKPEKDRWSAGSMTRGSVAIESNSWLM
jgi:hypothetical protein